jgi:serine/threonine-protein kinase RsbW
VSAPGTGPTNDLVELSIPVRADLVVLARLTAATVASRAGFGVEEIEDLRLAVEELCLSLVEGDEGGRLELTYARDEHAIEITCILEGGDQHRPNGSAEGGHDDLSLRILDALVDEHGRETRDGRPCAWLRKRRTRVTN